MTDIQQLYSRSRAVARLVRDTHERYTSDAALDAGRTLEMVLRDMMALTDLLSDVVEALAERGAHP